MMPSFDAWLFECGVRMCGFVCLFVYFVFLFLREQSDSVFFVFFSIIWFVFLKYCVGSIVCLSLSELVSLSVGVFGF